VTTASAAIRGLPGVNVETRAAVLAVAHEIGYRTDSQASGLRSGGSGMVGMILETAALADDPERTKLFYPRLINGLVSELTTAGMGLSLVARSNTAVLARLPIDVVVVQASSPAEVVAELPFGMPVVVGVGPADDAAAVVGHDYAAAATDCVSHLVAAGAGGIATVAAAESLSVVALIDAELRRAAGVVGVPYLSVATVADGIAAVGRGEVNALISPGLNPTTVLREVDAAGLSVPADVLLLSLGEGDLESQSHPSVTSLSFLGRRSGHVLGRVLTAGAQSGEFRSTTLPFELVVRESTDLRLQG
jgi:LacI family transcriptional regulator